MREVRWVDKRGYEQRSLVRDGDPDEMAEQGIQQGPPILDGLDWEAVKRDLHNSLVKAELFSWRDVQEKKGLRGAILSSLRKKIVYLYREAEHE